MGKALVLKSVNFSSVALEKVTIGDEVPCTAVSIDQSSVSVDTAEGTAQLTATVTPANTTDTISWASSDSRIASVSDEGLVTVHGIGEVTITVTCGSQTATVSANITTLKAQYPLSSLESYGLYIEQTNTADGWILKCTSGSGTYGIGQEYHNVDDVRIRAGTPRVECIKVPYGATRAKVKTTDDSVATISYFLIVNCNSLISYESKLFPEFVERQESVKSDVGAVVSYGQAFAMRPLTSVGALLDYVYFT